MNKGHKVMKNEPDYFPSMMLMSEDLPEVETWEPGKDYYIVVKVHMKGKNEIEEMHGKKMHMTEGHFEIREVSAITDEQADDL